MARRSNGEGTVGKRKDGRWMARFYITLPNGTRKRMHICKKTKAEVVEAMRDEMRRADFGAPVTHDGRTTGEWLSYWLNDIAPTRIKRSTWYQYESTIRNHLMPTLGNILLSKLSPHHIQEMINNQQKSGGSVRQAQIIRNTLSAALHTAVNREIIHKNVARMVDMPQSIRKERDIWTSEQIKHFLETAKTSQYFPIFKLICTYGLRRGEALGLRWCDVDFKNKVIHIRQQIVECGKHIFVETTKTNAGERDLPLAASVEATLCDYPHKGGEDSLIFQTRNGTPVQPNNLYRLFQKLREDAGLPHIAIHDVRHSVATMMKDAGIPIKDAQMMLGHADPTTTMRIYQHSSLDSKKLAMDKLVAMVS